VSQRSAIDPGAAALLIVLCAVWGGGQVAIKVGNQGITPLYHAAIRSGGAALLVWGWSALSGTSLTRRDGTLAHGMTIATLLGIYLVNRQPSRAGRPGWAAAPTRAGVDGRGGRIGAGSLRTADGPGNAPCRPGPGARETR
jgi:hypothetical protein